MGHCQPPAPIGDAVGSHAGHDMSSVSSRSGPPVAPPPPGALEGPIHGADRFYGTDQMARSRAVLRNEHGGMSAFKILVDQFEARIKEGRDGFFVDAEAWYGGDIDKFWLKSEIEGEFGNSLEQAEAQGLWSHAIGPFFDLQLGARYDFEPGGRAHLVAGIQGLAPYWFEVDAAAFLSDKGDVTARVEAEYDLRITQKLILQPKAELDFSLQDIEELGIGSGLSNLEAGLRLRYEVIPQLAPYLGIQYERRIGDTARFRRAAGEDAGGFSLIAGVRIWL